MIEVLVDRSGRWGWTMIGATGAALVRRTGYTTEAAAIRAARAYRAAFFRLAATIDHRQGACL